LFPQENPSLALQPRLRLDISALKKREGERGRGIREKETAK